MSNIIFQVLGHHSAHNRRPLSSILPAIGYRLLFTPVSRFQQYWRQSCNRYLSRRSCQPSVIICHSTPFSHVQQRWRRSCNRLPLSSALLVRPPFINLCQSLMSVNLHMVLEEMGRSGRQHHTVRPCWTLQASRRTQDLLSLRLSNSTGILIISIRSPKMVCVWLFSSIFLFFSCTSSGYQHSSTYHPQKTFLPLYLLQGKPTLCTVGSFPCTKTLFGR